MIGLIKIGELKVKSSGLSTAGSENPLYVFSGSIDTSLYKDITSNDAWMTVGRNSYDYMFCRNQITSWTAINNFSAITTFEQTVAAENFAVAKTDRDTIFTEQEQKDGWAKLIIETRNARQLRWNAARAYISYELLKPDSIDLGKTTTTHTNEYIVYGVEKFSKDGVDGLFDYLGNTSTYSGGTGYSGKTYWNQTDQDEMLTILEDGIY